MKPDIWGPFMWYIIHFIALDYNSNPSDEDKKQYKQFFENLHFVLPCYTCGLKYIEHLQILPLTDTVLQNNKELFNWTVKLHNIVNEQLHKKKWTIDKARKFYTNENNFTHNSYFNYKYLFFITLFLFITLSICFTYYHVIYLKKTPSNKVLTP